MKRAIAIGALAVAGALALTLVTLILLVATGTMKLYAIPTSAMEPTLRCSRPFPGCTADANDRVVALTRLVSYGRGDIVVFRATDEVAQQCGVPGTYVKRIVGLGRETVEIRRVEDGAYVFVDGERLEEPYIPDDHRDYPPEQKVRVPPDSFFVLGDHRQLSCDSRVYGSIPESDVRGKLVATYWPLDRITIR